MAARSKQGRHRSAARGSASCFRARAARRRAPRSSAPSRRPSRFAPRRPPRAPDTVACVIVLLLLLSLVGVVFVAAVGVGIAALAMRHRARDHERALREAIQAYAEERGGAVAFDNEGMLVKGPLGEGREKLTALRIM